MNSAQRFDYLIVGAGIIGMTIAYELKKRAPSATVAIVEKEGDVGLHASGRNSGVLHAGFYYDSDSLKARFTVEGNKKMREFCKKHNIAVNDTKKVVIAQSEQDIEIIEELKRRGDANGVLTEVIDEKRLEEIEPNAKTYKKALFSPNTASVDPKEVCAALKEDLCGKGVEFIFNKRFDRRNGDMKYDYLVNSAGLYADKVAQQFGAADNFTMLPFKGIYFKYMENKKDIRTNIYPVPDIKNPFLGVHYTVTSDNSIKIGPTAIPVFWREGYKGFSSFSIKEFLTILFYETKLFVLNSFNFRNLAINEIKNYNRTVFINKAKKMVKKIGDNFEPMAAGIRAQLLNTKTNQLVSDFVVEHTINSTHILNAVSPAFTCAFSFAEFVVNEIDKNQRSHI